MDKVRVHKGLRTNKLQRRKEHRQWIVTPPKRQLKNTMNVRVNTLAAKMGYDYEPNNNRLLHQMQQQFLSSTARYLGGKTHVSRMSRMDKVRAKEESGYQMKSNPLVKIFGRVNRLLEKQMKEKAMKALHSLRR